MFDNDWRNKGLGSLLLQRALVEMDRAQVETIESSVGAWNIATMALHKRQGFVFKSRDSNAGQILQRLLPK